MNIIFDKFGHRKDVVKGTVTILIITILQPAVNFLLLPLFTSFFDSKSFGYFSILNNISLFFTIISGLNIASAIAAHYKQFNSPQELKLFIGNTISFSLIFNTVLLTVMVLFGSAFSALVFKENVSFFPDVFLAIAIGLYSNVFLIYSYYLRYDKQIPRFSVFSIVQVFFLIGLQVGFLFFTHLAVTGVLTARLISAFLMIVIILITHRKYCFHAIDYRKYLKRPIMYSIMTGPALLIMWLTTYGDRFVLEHFLDLKSVGQYSFLITICSVAELAITALNSAFQPYLFDRFATNKAFTKNYYQIFILLSGIAISLLIIVCSNIDLLITNDEFLTTLPLTIPMLTSFIFSSVSNLYALQITFAQKGSYYLILSVIVLVINIGLNFLLIPGHGIQGAVLSNMLTKGIMALTIVRFAQKAFPLANIKPTVILLGLFIAIESMSWGMAAIGLINYKVAGLLQFALLALAGFIYYRKQIRGYFSLSNQIT